MAPKRGYEADFRTWPRPAERWSTEGRMTVSMDGNVVDVSMQGPSEKAMEYIESEMEHHSSAPLYTSSPQICCT